MPQMMTMRAYMLAAVAIVTSNAATLSVDFRVNDETELRCSLYVDNYHSNIAPPKLASLYIMKNKQTEWRIVAQINDLDPERVHVSDDEGFEEFSGNWSMPVQRHAYRSEIAFLSVSWPRGSSERYGQYKCRALQFNDNQDKLEVKEATLSIGSSLQPLAVLRVMRSDRQMVLGKISELDARLTLARDSLKSDVDKDVSAFNEELSDIEESFNTTLIELQENTEMIRKTLEESVRSSLEEHSKQLAELQAKFDSVLRRGFMQLWPQGTYALALPDSGCPSATDDDTWTTSFTRQHTESSERNRDAVSEGHHLRKPVLAREDGNNFIFQRFCLKTASKSPGPLWPQGSYCIRMLTDCPIGFATGSVHWDEENEAISGGRNVAPKTETKSTVQYCCRNDSNPELPIDLPRFKPFYLYRHGGKCQQVTSMHVSEEFIYFDTENSNNADREEGLVPDVELNNIRLHLCYYSQI